MGYNAVFMGIFLPHCEISLPLIAPMSNSPRKDGKPASVSIKNNKFICYFKSLVKRIITERNEKIRGV